jgi:ABC-type sugar transport system substrate-binding protein
MAVAIINMGLLHKHFVFIIVLLMIPALCGCNLNMNQSEKSDEVKFLIGMSQANLVEPWRISMNEDIKNEAANNKDVKVIFEDAAQNNQKQIDDVSKLMQEGIDLLIISPNDAQALTPVIREAYDKIPVIVLDRAIEGYNYTLYIGPDNEMIGKSAGKLVADMLGAKQGNVIEVEGLSGSPPSNSRNIGFGEEIKQFHNLKIVDTVFADWQRDIAEDKVKEALKSHPEANVIFAQNDAMALGAYRATKDLGLSEIKIIGVDGLFGTNGGLELVRNGYIDGTFTCSTGGREAIQYAEEILNHSGVIPKKVILKNTQITTDNVDRYINEKNVIPTAVDPNKKIVIGFSQLGTESEWRNANTASLLSAARQEGIDVLYQNAGGSQQAQINSIKYFIDQRVDVIVLEPVVETGWTEILQEASDANIPVILSNRSVDVEDESLYATWIGSDFVEQGRRVARWLVSNIKNKTGTVNIVELEGTAGSASSIGRKQGFEEIIKEYSRFNIIRSVSTNYDKETGRQAMEMVLNEEKKKIDAVFAFSDDEALGAISAIEKSGKKPGKDITIVSVDAERSGFQAMIAGKLNCSVENNPLSGVLVMKTVKDILLGKEIPDRIYLAEEVFPAEVAKKELDNRKY